MKKLFWLILLITTFMAFSGLRAETGEVWGYVYNGTQDSALVNNIDVQLLVYRGNMLIDDSSHTTATNTAGRFHFSELQIDSTLVIYPRATYNTVVYYGPGVRLNERQFRKNSNIVVYDTTSQRHHVNVQMEHIFLTAENGKVSIREIFLIANSGKKTFIGDRTKNTNRRFVLQYPLIKGFENFELLTPEAENSVFIKNNSLYEIDLLPPGTRQLSYRFQVSHSGDQWRYTRPVIYPTGGINLFLSQPELSIEGAGIVPMGDFHIKGKKYQHFSMQQLMPGMIMEFTLKNLPKQTAPIQLMVLIAVGIFLLVGFGYTFLKNKDKN
ncbi:MAG TPA: hypothetical protein ENN22_07220 [bacterium]|nr:hypothetical protein [bacterium]